MKCDNCGWSGEKEEMVIREREKTIIDLAAGVFFAWPRKKRFYCPKCDTMLWSEFSDGPLSGY